MTNDLHDAPFGLLEDVYVDESQRGNGLGTALVKEGISAARDAGCYTLIATSRTSRPKVHELYERLGFEKHGVEFRMNFTGGVLPPECEVSCDPACIDVALVHDFLSRSYCVFQPQ